jgi:hypothetical protein
MKRLPYQAKTASGDIFDIDFPLHEDTGDPVRVGQLVSAVLATLDREIGIGGEVSNGDVLQAVAMALAVRSGMIHAPYETTAPLARSLVEAALEAVADSAHRPNPAGHA